jgi:predicted transcriptional regulator
MTSGGEEDMSRKAFSTTMDADTLKALKLVAVKRDRSLNAVLQEAVERYLAEEAVKDPDAQVFLRRAKEPLEDCMAAIERRIARIKRQRV